MRTIYRRGRLAVLTLRAFKPRYKYIITMTNIIYMDYYFGEVI